jgi:hypothetical protein
MSKFTVNFKGRSEDLLREIGMSLNSFINRLVERNGAKIIRPMFLNPEDVDTDKIRNRVVTEVAWSIQMRPNENRDFKTLSNLVLEKHKKDIDNWIEDNREKLAEFIMIRVDDETAQPKRPRWRFHRR